MGAATSKSARKLPTTTPTQARPVPKWAGARTPHPDPLYPEGTQPPPASAAPSGSSYTSRDPTASGQAPSNTGKARAGFSGEKDDALKRDAMDPQFMSNLSRLGQVQIQDAVKFVKTPPLAQRTLQARTPEYNSPGSLPPPGSLAAPTLITLLDRLKQLPPGIEVSKIYREYGVDPSKMEEVRRWVNSVSVGEEDEVRVEEGNRIIEMKAAWVDSAKPSTPRVGAPRKS